MRKSLIYLAFALVVSCAAHAAPYDCGAADPHRVREIFENSSYARGSNPGHRPLKANLPIIIKHPDGTCTVKISVLDWQTSQPAGELNLDLVVLYLPAIAPTFAVQSPPLIRMPVHG